MTSETDSSPKEAELDALDAQEIIQAEPQSADHWAKILRADGATNIRYHKRTHYLDNCFAPDQVQHIPPGYIGFNTAAQIGELPLFAQGSKTHSEVTAGFLLNAFHSNPEAVNYVIASPGEVAYLMWVRNPNSKSSAPSANAYRPVLFNMYFRHGNNAKFLAAVQENPNILETTFAGVYPHLELPRVQADKVRVIQIDKENPPLSSATSNFRDAGYVSSLPTLEFSQPVGKYPLPIGTRATRAWIGRGKPPERY